MRLLSQSVEIGRHLIPVLGGHESGDDQSAIDHRFHAAQYIHEVLRCGELRIHLPILVEERHLGCVVALENRATIEGDALLIDVESGIEHLPAHRDGVPFRTLFTQHHTGSKHLHRTLQTVEPERGDAVPQSIVDVIKGRVVFPPPVAQVDTIATRINE